MSFVLPVVLAGLGFLLVLVLTLRYAAQSLRERGRTALAERLPEADVLRSETLAQSFGEESRGVTQVRGNGALALTKSELFFLLYVPERELRIPLRSIQATSLVRTHLGKTTGAKLLKIEFTAESGRDSIAWCVRDPEVWLGQIDALRA